ncbi:hypothetical protein AF78_04315 [Aliarcobacter butzleri L353]|uniref:hypothetical protein n=1 Tax=Aliarcobacter butzleri TaxID=28197 RepID=UPI00065974EC|nr:hypothetical protein [Aliarcobacter butzleri]KLE05994.1 hypothetical protein AF78_04315 [Aliarcobacter butzleri L353]
METYNQQCPSITVVGSSSNPLAKKFPKDLTYTPGVLYSGKFQVYVIATMLGLYQLIKQLTKFNVLILGIPRNGLISGNIVSSKNINVINAITRTKEDIGWNPSGVSFLLIDIDFGDIPNFILNTAKEVLAFLISLDPELIHCGILILPSSSQRYDTSKKSWHCYIKVCNANDLTVKHYAETLQSICWIKGLGNIKLSKSGSMLVRQVFDIAVFSPERIVVESCFSDDETVIFHEIEPLIQEGMARELYE